MGNKKETDEVIYRDFTNNCEDDCEEAVEYLDNFYPKSVCSIDNLGNLTIPKGISYIRVGEDPKTKAAIETLENTLSEMTISPENWLEAGINLTTFRNYRDIAKQEIKSWFH